MPEQNRERIQHNINLAEQLGARVEYLSGTSVAEEILEYARHNNVTKIIVGKPLRPRWFEILRGRSVIDQILHESKSIDVYIVSEEVSQTISLPPPLQLLRRRWDRYLKSVMLVVLITLLNFLIYGSLEPTNLVMVYLAAVVVSAVFFGRGPSIVASLLSVLAFDYFFIQPRYSFAVSDTEYIVTFIGFLAVGLIISSSASLLRDQVDQLKRREQTARAINSLSKELTAAVTLDDVLTVVVRDLGQVFNFHVVILLPEGQSLSTRCVSDGLKLDQNEQAVALWAFQNRQPAGQGTETLSAVLFRFLPLLTSNGIVGVLGVKSKNQGQSLTQDDRLLIDNYANLAALAIERALFAEQASQAESLRTTERLQSALLNSISHELRTPLASIMGALTSLEEDEKASKNEITLNHEMRVELIKSAAGQTRQLNHLVGNLLDMTRIQSGAVRLKRSAVDIQDLFGAILNQMEDRLRGRRVDVNIADALPSVSLDAVLIGQALVNLIDNAVKFSAPGTPILVCASIKESQLHLTVQDSGPGVDVEELDRIFEKFYRGNTPSSSGGTGLGLSICRGIVEAHSGRIWAQNVTEGGLRVVISIPIDAVVSRE
jgi:two-component system sensor histidine kinase KdpD